MRLADFRALPKEKQDEEVMKARHELAKTVDHLEKNGTFTFYDPKKTGGLVMEYIPTTNSTE